MDKNIPCLDLKGQHQQIRKEIFDAFEKVYDQTAFSGGPFVESFEKSFAQYTGARHAVGVSNGTTALHLAMLALNIGKGDEVIIPANSFIATAWGPTHAGAVPVFVDCDSLTWQINPAKIEVAITPRTKAVIGVHLYGQAFDVDVVKAICEKHQLYLVEDAAQAHGTKYKEQAAGTFGEIGTFSFYPGKNLGACGEAGALITNNAAYNEHLRSLRNHGSLTRYQHDEIGFNYRMGGLEAASLSVKLKYLDAWNSRRREIAHRYLEEIENPKLKFQKQSNGSEGIYHLFICTVEDKAAFVNHLTNHGIIPAFHYPIPCHLQKAYVHLGYKKGDFPESEYLAEHCVSLPMFAELSDEEVNKIIGVLNKY